MTDSPNLPSYPHVPFAAPDEHGRPPKEPTKPGVTATRLDSRAMARQLVKLALKSTGKAKNLPKAKRGSGVKGSHPKVSVANVKYY